MVSLVGKRLKLGILCAENENVTAGTRGVCEICQANVQGNKFHRGGGAEGGVTANAQAKLLTRLVRAVGVGVKKNK